MNSFLPKIQLPLLGVSLVLNLWLAAAWHFGQSSQHTARPAVKEAPPVAAAVRKEVQKQPPPAPFRWSQLEAPDFATYVKNLRSIGCPEATIRDIIQAELREIYDAKRASLQNPQVAAAQAGGASVLLQQWQHEETAILSKLVAAPAEGRAATQSPAAAGGTQIQPVANSPTAETAADHASTAMIPAAFVHGNDPKQPTPTDSLSLELSEPGLDPVNAGIIQRLRTDFVQSLEGATQDPNSPEYADQWFEAMRRSDSRFSALYGKDAFVQTQIAAMQKMAAEARAKTAP